LPLFRLHDLLLAKTCPGPDLDMYYVKLRPKGYDIEVKICLWLGPQVAQGRYRAEGRIFRTITAAAAGGSRKRAQGLCLR